MGLEKISVRGGNPSRADIRTNFRVHDCSRCSIFGGGMALSVSGVAFVASILTSLATGLPEVDEKPTEEQKEE